MITEITEQNIGNETTAAEIPYIKRTIGGRTYTVLIHFKENAEETAKDKIKRLLKSEFENT